MVQLKRTCLLTLTLLILTAYLHSLASISTSQPLSIQKLPSPSPMFPEDDKDIKSIKTKPLEKKVDKEKAPHTTRRNTPNSQANLKGITNTHGSDRVCICPSEECEDRFKAMNLRGLSPDDYYLYNGIVYSNDKPLTWLHWWLAQSMGNSRILAEVRNSSLVPSRHLNVITSSPLYPICIYKTEPIKVIPQVRYDDGKTPFYGTINIKDFEDPASEDTFPNWSCTLKMPSRYYLTFNAYAFSSQPGNAPLTSMIDLYYVNFNAELRRRSTLKVIGLTYSPLTVELVGKVTDVRDITLIRLFDVIQELIVTGDTRPDNTTTNSSDEVHERNDEQVKVHFPIPRALPLGEDIDLLSYITEGQEDPTKTAEDKRALVAILTGQTCGPINLRLSLERGKVSKRSFPTGATTWECEIPNLPADPIEESAEVQELSGFYRLRFWSQEEAAKKGEEENALRTLKMLYLKAPELEIPPEITVGLTSNIERELNKYLKRKLKVVDNESHLSPENFNTIIISKRTNALMLPIPQGEVLVRVIDLSSFDEDSLKGPTLLLEVEGSDLGEKASDKVKVKVMPDDSYLESIYDSYTAAKKEVERAGGRVFDLLLYREEKAPKSFKALLLREPLTDKELEKLLFKGKLKFPLSRMLIHPFYRKLISSLLSEHHLNGDLLNKALSSKTETIEINNSSLITPALLSISKDKSVPTKLLPGKYILEVRGRDLQPLRIPIHVKHPNKMVRMRIYLIPSRWYLWRHYLLDLLRWFLLALLLIALLLLVYYLIRRRKVKIEVKAPEQLLAIPMKVKSSLIDTPPQGLRALLAPVYNLIESLKRARGPQVIAKFSDYLLLEKIATGGMGTVYKALNPQTREMVAVKILHPHLLDKEEVIERFEKEAEVLKILHHPNIVRLVDAGVFNGQPYIVYEFINGKNLKQLLEEKGKLPLSTALKIFIQICEALDYAHQKGIIHRDIKPENIMVTADYVVKLTDFGIAKVLKGEGTTSDYAGTPLYASPEQIMGKGVDARSDIYSLGIVMFQVLTGHLPYDVADNVFSAVAAHVTQDPHKMKTLEKRALSQYVPLEIERIIMKMLEKNPEKRYQSVEELLVDLREFMKRFKM